jgi:hypothetical protein
MAVLKLLKTRSLPYELMSVNGQEVSKSNISRRGLFEYDHVTLGALFSD